MAPNASDPRKRRRVPSAPGSLGDREHEDIALRVAAADAWQTGDDRLKGLAIGEGALPEQDMGEGNADLRRHLGLIAFAKRPCLERGDEFMRSGPLAERDEGREGVQGAEDERRVLAPLERDLCESSQRAPTRTPDCSSRQSSETAFATSRKSSVGIGRTSSSYS